VGQRFVSNGKTYELLGRVGDGAAGLVRKAKPIDGENIVAVKFLAPDPKYIDTAAFDDVARRFKREGERGVHLRHESLVTILSYSDNESGSAFRSRGLINPFIVMEYLEAKTLESYIRSITPNERGVFALTQGRLGIAVQLASALEHLKRQRLVHRDVKPANIFLRRRGQSRWNAKLGDFGVMKWGDFHAALATGTLTVVAQKGLGTLKYMSPEQAIRPAEVTIKSDIWSLGITLFELFSGQILASAHHVYELQAARRAHGTTMSRYSALRCRLSSEDEAIADLLLDMFLAADGRPTIDKIRGRLEWEYARRFGGS
jgi:serine/threonine-protein kinase